MMLRSLRVEQLRQFRRPVEIRDLEPGINLFTGPNESGKSTLVRAIRAAFFERCRSTSVEDLRPWGDSAAAPTVSLEFEWQGETWRLVKSFLGRKRCDLFVGERGSSGEKAEEMLAALLGYEFAARGPSQERHWGIPGLLWVEQGLGQNIREPLDQASAHLGRALGEILGDATQIGGDRLIEAVERQRAQLLSGTGKPTAEYARVIREVEDLGNDCTTLQTRIETYRQQVDHLGQLRRQREQDEAGRIWEEHRRRAQESRQALEQVQVWQREQQRDQRALEELGVSIATLRTLLDNLAGRQQDLDQRRHALHEAQQGLDEQELQQSQVAACLDAARAAHEQARSDLRLAHAHQRQLDIGRELAQLDADISDLGNSLDKARSLQGQLLEQRLSLQSVQLDAGVFDRLLEVDQELAHLKIRQEAVATRVQFDLLDGQTLLLGAERLRGAGERLLLEPADLDVAGIGRLRILPGGQDIADLARQGQMLEDEHAGLRERLGVASLAQARARMAQASTLEADIRRDEQMLSSIAPEGVDELAARLQLRQSRRQDLQDAIQELPAPMGEAPSVAEAETALDEAERRLQQAQEADRTFRETLGLRRQSLENARRECDRLEAETQDPERLRQQEQAGVQLLDLQARQDTLQMSMAQRQLRIDKARPEILAQEVDRFERSAVAAEREAAARRDALARTEASLQALGAEGLEEQLAEKRLEHERLTRRRDQLERRAAALDLLQQRLREHRQRLARRLQGPLQVRLDHYLGLLLPQARLDLDQALVPSLLIRPAEGGEEQAGLDCLSFGAREQMGLISRLAYADLLKQAGKPTLIILDDALVHADEDRLALMKRILYDAAQRHQILLFSCHPQRWNDLGAQARDIVALKSGQPPA